MRDAFGGVFTMNFLLVFIFIYIAFTAVSLNYAKAFRVKNAVIDFVEQNNITDLDQYFGPMAMNETTSLDNALNRLSYYKTCNTNEKLVTSEGIGYCYRGVVILKLDEEHIITNIASDGSPGAKSVHYKIQTYADWELGALNKLLALAGANENADSVVSGTWAINGKAKVVVKY